MRYSHLHPFSFPTLLQPRFLPLIGYEGKVLLGYTVREQLTKQEEVQLFPLPQEDSFQKIQDQFA